MKKHFIRKTLLALAAMLVLAVGTLFIISKVRPGTVQQWIGSQLQNVANSYLYPTLSFTDLDYEYPATVSLKNLRLTADDPAHKGKTIDIIACAHATLTLGEVPRIGKPIIIEKIVLDQPLVSAVAVAPDSKDFVGFSNLVRSSSAAAPSRQSSGDQTRLSDVFRMRLIQLIDGKIVYDPRIAGTVPMVLDQINTTLNIEPTSAGWYKLNTVIARKPVFEMQLAGQLSLDSFSVHDLNLKLLADLSQDKLDYLPPELQRLLRQVNARGKLTLEASGNLPDLDPARGKMQAEVKLDRLNIATDKIHVPLESFDLVARLEGGKLLLPSLKISALGGTADISGSTALNQRLDADLRIKVAGMVLEKLLSDPGAEGASATKLDFDLQVAGSLQSLLGNGSPPPPGAPLASITLRNFHLTTDDPLNPGQPLDFVACDTMGLTLSSLPSPGKPVVIDSLVLERPAVRFVAVEADSHDLAGFADLRKIFASQSTSPAPTASSQPPKLGDLFCVKSATVNNAVFYYDPRIPDAVPMSLDNVGGKITLDSPGRGIYDVAVRASSQQEVDLDLGGRFDLDTFNADALKLSLTADLGSKDTSYLPPQLQLLLQPYAFEGKFTLDVTGALPLANPAGYDLQANVKLDDFAATFGDFRIPVAHLKLPVHVKAGQIEFQDASQLGGAMLEAFHGTASLTGTLALNDHLDSTLKLNIDGMRLQDLMAAKLAGPKSDLIGDVHADVQLTKAPLRIIIAKAAQGPEPPAEPSALASLDLPEQWGSGKVQITHARLAGLEVVQHINNFVKTVFTDLFKHGNGQPRTIVPHETVTCAFEMTWDQIEFSNIHYDGEIVAADGQGYVTVDQKVSLDLTGGPMAKLGGLGSFGNWLKEASDSLLYYHISGTFQDLKYEVKRGDGKPIVEGAKELVDKGANAVETGVQKAGNFLGNLINHNK